MWRWLRIGLAGAAALLLLLAVWTPTHRRGPPEVNRSVTLSEFDSTRALARSDEAASLVVDRNNANLVYLSDVDLTTDALPEDIRAIVAPMASAVWEQGARFGTIGCKIDGRLYEITTHRAEAYTTDSRKPQVVFSDSVEDDLARRDFTVNAMALEVPEPRLVDPHGGIADLHAGVLRTPLAPEESFIVFNNFNRRAVRGSCSTLSYRTTRIRSACADCYGSVGGCAASNCALQCLGDSGSSGCRNCVTSNCAAEFEICSGWTYGQ